jgi:hypothetical protein
VLDSKSPKHLEMAQGHISLSARGRGGRGFTARGEAGVEGGGSGRRRGGEGEGNELHGEEDVREGVERRERKGEAVLGKGRLTSGPHRGGWRRLNRPRRARARGRGDGWAARWAQSGGKGAADAAGPRWGEGEGPLGRARGRGDWAAEPAGPRGKRGGKRGGSFLFIFPILIIFLKACFHKFNPQTKDMQGPAWCNNPNKVLLGFIITI